MECSKLAHEKTFLRLNKAFPYNFVVEDSYACKNLFESKGLDEEKKTDLEKKIKRISLFLSITSTQILTSPEAKCLA
jgi:hypothetical protein